MNGKRSFMKVVVATLAVLVCIGYTGCVDDAKDLHVDNGTGEANEFDFSTKKVVDINLAYDVEPGYQVQFEMYTKSPLALDAYQSYVKDTTLVPFLSGRCDENGKISFKGELPASVKEIYAYSFGIGVPALMKATVSDDGVVSEFKVVEVTGAASTRAGELGASGTSFWKTYNVTLNKPTLPVVPSMAVSKEDKVLIDKSFPKDQNYDIVKAYYQPGITLTGKANVKIYSVSHAANSNRTNALAYYVYQNENATPQDVNANLQLAFPELTKKKPAEGEGVQLLNGTETTFEAGSCIGFALLPGITPDNIKTTDAHVLYSSFGSSWNTYSFPGLSRAGVPHMVMSVLRQDKEGHAIIAIGFEDQPFSTTYGTNRGDFRDDLFIVEVDPATSLPGDLPTPPTEDKPTYDFEFTSSGILCFEDCWPAKGDYDLNDVVIAYERTICMKNNAIAALKENYTFLNNGAVYANGFGYQLMGVKQSDVAECTVTSDDYKFEGQGLDKTSDEANVMLFDDARKLKKGTAFSVFTSFNKSVLMTGVNPFIVTAGNFNGIVNLLEKGRMEVHLPTTKISSTVYLPTSKAKMDYFGTKDDKSVPADKVYYVRQGNYPFALELIWNTDKNGGVGNFVIPKEHESIEQTYSEFKEWVESNGKKNTDWYYHPTK